MRHFSPLSTATLSAKACFRRPAQTLLARIALDSPAVDTMTDFKRVAAVTIDSRAAIADANRKMIEHGIRLLLVVEGPDLVLGIITASDILGEKPMQVVQERGVPHSEITVRGLFSASQIARQLGVPVHVGDVARTFAEIETLLNHERATTRAIR